MAHIEKYYINDEKTKMFQAVIEAGDPNTRKKEDAEEWIASMLYKRNESYEVDKNKATVGDQLGKWLKYKKTTVRATTYDRYQYKVNSHLKPWFGKIPIQELEPFHIEDYLMQKRIDS